MSHPGAMIERMFDPEMVAEWSAHSYEISGHEASVAVPRGSDESLGLSMYLVAIPSLRRLDVVVNAIRDLERASNFVAAQAQAGWEVCAVVPLPQLADAHNTCRGWSAVLQGCWEPRPGELAFTAPEVP